MVYKIYNVTCKWAIQNPQTFSDDAPQPQNKRGRPVGKTDSTQRTRRTAQEIGDDKIRIAQMKLDALKETEERELAAKTRARPEKSKGTQPKAIVQEIPMAKPAPRDDSLSPSPKYYVSKNKLFAILSWPLKKDIEI